MIVAKQDNLSNHRHGLCHLVYLVLGGLSVLRLDKGGVPLIILTNSVTSMSDAEHAATLFMSDCGDGFVGAIVWTGACGSMCRHAL